MILKPVAVESLCVALKQVLYLHLKEQHIMIYLVLKIGMLIICKPITTSTQGITMPITFHDMPMHEVSAYHIANNYILILATLPYRYSSSIRKQLATLP
jgi:hypothetical protein